MDKELKAKWVAALRSGEYQQGYATLYDSGIDRYCCLGVLISVADVFDGPLQLMEADTSGSIISWGRTGLRNVLS
jgi:DNA-directed RNA polymerase subunit N (RpoN/RPB10)